MEKNKKPSTPNNFNKKQQGDFGEGVAVEYLINNGYIILERNFRSGRFGEIDIIAKDRDYICFIEVKTRSSLSFGTPSESITYRKQQKIRKISSLYISKNKLFNNDFRFDVVEVLLIKNNSILEVLNINLIENAF